MATNYQYCPGSTMAQLAACVAANGGPPHPQQLAGVGTPEAAVVGYWIGIDQYFDTDAEILYVFNGASIGATTGWVAINP